jgi:hypothetical protein
MFGVIIIVVISNYLLIVPTVILVIALGLMRRFYIRTARDVKRIESVGMSFSFAYLNSHQCSNIVLISSNK